MTKEHTHCSAANGDARETIARKLMEFDGHRSWELLDHQQLAYLMRADVILDALSASEPQEAPVPLEPKAFEPAIKRVLEDWFGEAFGHMDEEKHRRKYLLDPLCKAACSVSRPVRS